MSSVKSAYFIISPTYTFSYYSLTFELRLSASLWHSPFFVLERLSQSRLLCRHVTHFTDNISFNTVSFTKYIFSVSILGVFYVCMYVCQFQNVLRCPTSRLHCFLSSHWPSFRFLSFMAFLVPSIQFFFGLPRALSCFGIHFNATLGNLFLPFF